MKEVITFFGADAKVGTTMLAQSFAELLAGKKARILLIFASQEMHDSFLNLSENDCNTIDSLRDIENLKREDIDAIIMKNGNYDYIGGIKSPFKLRCFKPTLIGEIIEIIGIDYDYVIIDGGHNYQYPLPISSLLCATRRFFVLDQSPRSVSRFRDLDELVLKSNEFKEIGKRDKIIINKEDRKTAIYSIDQITALFGRNVLSIPMVSGGREAEANCKTFSKQKAFTNALTEVAGSIF